MQTKEKRKSNPRRRLLMRLIFGIVSIAIVTVLGWRALQPTGAQIVYIAPDENGYDAIWLADLNDPENPRQLTHHESASIVDFQVSRENSIVFYSLHAGTPTLHPQFWKLNTATGDYQMIALCEINVCRDFQLHPNGEWLAFHEYGENSLIKVSIQNLETSEYRVIYETQNDFRPQYTPMPRWVGNTNQLVFRVSGEDEIDEFAFYSIEENEIVETHTLNVHFRTPYFSDNGSLYSHYVGSAPRSETLNPISIRQLNNPDETLYTTPYNNITTVDWLDNDNILIRTQAPSGQMTVPPDELNMLTVSTGTNQTLMTSDTTSFYSMAFNYNGSQILYGRLVRPSTIVEVVIFDMETREEITLPIIGRSPQWVNGGR